MLQWWSFLFHLKTYKEVIIRHEIKAVNFRALHVRCSDQWLAIDHYFCLSLLESQQMKHA